MKLQTFGALKRAIDKLPNTHTQHMEFEYQTRSVARGVTDPFDRDYLEKSGYTLIKHDGPGVYFHNGNLFNPDTILLIPKDKRHHYGYTACSIAALKEIERVFSTAGDSEFLLIEKSINPDSPTSFIELEHIRTEQLIRFTYRKTPLLPQIF